MTTITMTHISKNCIVCGEKSTSIVYLCSKNKSEYFSCDKHYNFISETIIPIKELETGIISHYNYHGDPVTINFIRTDGEECSGYLANEFIKHYIEIDEQIWVPVFFIENKRSRRPMACIKLCNLNDIYTKNNNIGLYEIDINRYNDLENHHKIYIQNTNRMLLELLLENNNLAKNILELSKKQNNRLFFIPHEIIEYIIYLIFKK